MLRFASLRLDNVAPLARPNARADAAYHDDHNFYNPLVVYVSTESSVPHHIQIVFPHGMLTENSMGGNLSAIFSHVVVGFRHDALFRFELIHLYMLFLRNMPNTLTEYISSH